MEFRYNFCIRISADVVSHSEMEMVREGQRVGERGCKERNREEGGRKSLAVGRSRERGRGRYIPFHFCSALVDGAWRVKARKGSGLRVCHGILAVQGQSSGEAAAEAAGGAGGGSCLRSGDQAGVKAAAQGKVGEGRGYLLC